MARIEVRYGGGAAGLGEGLAGGIRNYRQGLDYQRAVKGYVAGQEANKLRSEVGQAANATQDGSADFTSFLDRSKGLMGDMTPEQGALLQRDLFAAQKSELDEKRRAQLAKSWGALADKAAEVSETPEEKEMYRMLGQSMGQLSMDPNGNPDRAAIALQQFAQEQSTRYARKRYETFISEKTSRKVNNLLDAGAPMEQVEAALQEEAAMLFGLNGFRTGSSRGSQQQQMTSSQAVERFIQGRLRNGSGMPLPEEIEEVRQGYEQAFGGGGGGQQMSPAQQAGYRYRDAQDPQFAPPAGRDVQAPGPMSPVPQGSPAEAPQMPPAASAPPQADVPGGGVPRGTQAAGPYGGQRAEDSGKPPMSANLAVPQPGSPEFQQALAIFRKSMESGADRDMVERWLRSVGIDPSVVDAHPAEFAAAAGRR